MELRHLKYFRAVAEELHFGRAARRLHIAQPPLSQQIRQLEHELGVALFVRSTRKVELTPAGAVYLSKVRAILDSVEDAGRQANRVASGLEGNLAIGCVGSATYSLLPQLVKGLRDEMPQVEVNVRGEMLAPAQLQALVAGEIDLALLRPPVEHPDVQWETVRRDRLLVAMPADHRLVARRVLTVGDLRDEDFISHAGQGRSTMSAILLALAGAAGFAPRVRHEVEETSTLVTLVAAGLGVAVVPAPTADLGVTGILYRPLRPASLGVDLVAAWRTEPQSPTVQRAVAVLRRLA